MTFPKPPDSPIKDPEVVIVMRQYRAAIDRQDEELMRDMAKRWLQIEQRLDADISALAFEMTRRKEQGEVITQQMIWRAERYKKLKSQMEEQITLYNRNAVRIISSTQSEAAVLGVRSAQDAISVSIGPFGGAFDRINVSAVEAGIGYAGDGSPLYRLMKKDYPDAVDGLVNALVNGVARGQGPGKTALDMANGMGMGLNRAVLIARTETARMYRTASVEQYRKSGVVSGFQRLVKKSTACMACLALDGQVFDVLSEFYDHPAGKAEVPGNLIMTSSPDAFMTLNHNGDIVIIRTSSGKFLSVTPQHPVLTDRGWVAAAFIKKGDNVISHSGHEWASSSMGPDKNHMVSLIEDIPSSFGMYRLGRVPKTSKNLYGNIGDGDVDIVFTNRLLWDSLDASGRKHLKQYMLGLRNVGLVPFDTFRYAAKMFMGELSSSCELLGSKHGSLSFFLSHFANLQNCCVFSSPSFNSVFNQNSFNNHSGNIELLRNSKFRLSSIVTSANSSNITRRKSDFVPGISGNFDALNLRSFGFIPKETISLEVIREALFSSVPLSGSVLGTAARDVIFDSVTEVNITAFSGHVYSFQNKEEWYFSNGIISHNCTAIPIIEGLRPSKWQTGPEWFETLTPEEQRAKMGPQRYELWKDGQITWDDMVTLKHNDTWGSSPQVTPVKDLQ